MRNSIYLFCLLVVITLSCKKTDNNLLIAEGTYTGTFQRQVADTGIISNVSIAFSAGKWTGQSQLEKYPALCNGSYIVNGEANIQFKNACSWTTEFDGTLILSGQYHLAITDSSLTIERDYTGNVRDIYELKKQ